MTIHRCAECAHKSEDHGFTGSGYRDRVGPCGFGGCACRLTPDQVVEANPAVEIPTWPGFNHATGKWADR